MADQHPRARPPWKPPWLLHETQQQRSQPATATTRNRETAHQETTENIEISHPRNNQETSKIVDDPQKTKPRSTRARGPSSDPTATTKQDVLILERHYRKEPTRHQHIQSKLQPYQDSTDLVTRNKTRTQHQFKLSKHQQTKQITIKPRQPNPSSNKNPASANTNKQSELQSYQDSPNPATTNQQHATDKENITTSN